MPLIEIYTTPLCSYCFRAKRLLSQKGAAFTEIDVSASDRRRQMRERANGRNTVPQIFIAGHGIGGCDELMALERRGELDRLLAGEAAEAAVDALGEGRPA